MKCHSGKEFFFFCYRVIKCNIAKQNHTEVASEVTDLMVMGPKVILVNNPGHWENSTSSETQRPIFGWKQLSLSFFFFVLPSASLQPVGTILTFWPLPHSRTLIPPGGELLHMSGAPVFLSCDLSLLPLPPRGCPMPQDHPALEDRGAHVPESHGTIAIRNSLLGRLQFFRTLNREQTETQPQALWERSLFACLQLWPEGQSSALARLQGPMEGLSGNES